MDNNFVIKENVIDIICNFTIYDPDNNELFSPSIELRNQSNSDVVPFILTKTICEDLDKGTECWYNLENIVELNYEIASDWKLRINVNDKNGLKANKDVLIQVKDVNEPVNKFLLDGREMYSKDVIENTVITQLGQLNVVDSDQHQLHSFNIQNIDGLSSNFLKYFTIEDRNIKINPDFQFNYEETSRLTLQIQVVDNSEKPIKQQFNISINVIDINEPPTYLSLSSHSVKENTKLGSQIAVIDSHDPDNIKVHRQNITYSIVYDQIEAFQIFGQSLSVKNQSKLNFEVIKKCNLTIQATDNGAPPLKSISTFWIYLTDSNDAPEVIELTSSYIAKDTQINTTIANVVYKDEDIGQDHVFQLVYIEPIKYKNSFSIDPDTGNVMKTSNDLIGDPTITMAISVVDNGEPPMNASKSVTIQVVDEILLLSSYLNLNYNKSSNENLQLPENIPANSTVGSIDIIINSTASIEHVTTYQDSVSLFQLNEFNCSNLIGYQQCRGNVGVLRQFNYEMTPIVYLKLRVAAAGGLVGHISHLINIADVNEPPQDIVALPQQLAVQESRNPKEFICKFSAVDEDNFDTGSFDLTTTDARIILSDDGVLLTGNQSFNYEDGSSMNITIRVRDKGNLKMLKTFIIYVEDINEVPVNIYPESINMPENPKNGTIATRFQIVDPDKSILFQNNEIELDNDPTNIFQITSANELIIVTNSTNCVSQSCGLNYEIQPIVTLLFKVTDKSTQPILSRIFNVAINVTNVNEPPIRLFLKGNYYIEENRVGKIGTILVDDPDRDDVHRCQVIDQTKFEILPSTNELVVKLPLDYEEMMWYIITISCADSGGLSVTQELSIEVKDEPETPTFSSLSQYPIESYTLPIPENTPRSHLIGHLYSQDPDNDDYLMVSCKSSMGLIECHNTTCQTISNIGTKCTSEIRVIESHLLNYEVQPQDLSFSVSIVDKYDLVLINNLSISILDVNEPPVDITINQNTSSVITIVENSHGVLVGEIDAMDDDKDESYSFAINNTQSIFQIRNQNQLWIMPSAQLNYEDKNQYSLIIEAIDASLVHRITKVFFVQLIDVNEPPDSLILSITKIPENSSSNVVLSTLIGTDPDENPSNQMFSFNLLNYNSIFYIDQSSLMLRFNVNLDYETSASYNLSIQISDSGRPILQSIFSVQLDILDINESPYNVTLSSNQINESSNVGSVIGQLHAMDSDSSDSLTFSLATSETRFILTSTGQLQSGMVFDYESMEEMFVDIITSDNGQPIQQVKTTFPIHILNQNEPPVLQLVDIVTNKNVSFVEIKENSKPGIELIRISVYDPDNDDLNTVTMTPYNEHVSIKKSDTDYILVSNISYDFENMTGGTYDMITIKVTDISGAADEKVLELRVINVNEAPQSVSIAGQPPSSLTLKVNIQENIYGPQTLATLIIRDPDQNDRHSLTIQSAACVSNNQYYNQSFEFNDIQLMLQQDQYLNYEECAKVNLSIIVEDIEGLVLQFQLDVEVVNVNDAPQISDSYFNEIPSYSIIGRKLGHVTVTDEDVEDSIDCMLMSHSDWISITKVINSTNYSLVVKETRFINQSNINITIQCTDNNIPSLSTIWIGDQINISANYNEEPKLLSYIPLIELLEENTLHPVSLGRLVLTTEFSNQSINIQPNLTTIYCASTNIALDNNGTMAISTPVNYESDPSLYINIKYNDPSRINTSTQIDVTVPITDINEPPTSVYLLGNTSSINERLPMATEIDNLMTIDPDEDNGQYHMYIITRILLAYRNDTNMSDNLVNARLFNIVNNQTLVAGSNCAEIIQYNDVKYIVLTVASEDVGGLTVESDVKLMVDNINDRPSDIVLIDVQYSVAENVSVGTEVGEVAVKDPDLDDTHQCSVDNNQYIQMSGMKLLVYKHLDYETVNDISIKIICQDPFNLSISTTFQLHITDIDEPPYNLMLTNNKWIDNFLISDIIDTITSIDPEGDQVSYKLLSCKDIQCPFEVSHNGSITLNQSLALITDDDILMTIAASDSQNNSITEVVIATIMRSNLPNIEISIIGPDRFPENVAIGSKLGQVELVNVNGSYANIFCKSQQQESIYVTNDNNIILNSSLDYESTPILSINIICYKNRFQSVAQTTKNVTVLDVNEPIKEITVDLIKNIKESNYSNSSVDIGWIFVNDPESDQSNVACDGSATSNSELVINVVFVNVTNEKLLQFMVGIEGLINYEGKERNGIDILFSCTDQVSDISQKGSLMVLDVNEPPTKMIITPLKPFDLDALVDGDIYGEIVVIDPDINQSFQIIVQEPCDKYLIIDKHTNEIHVNNIEFAWPGVLNCQLLVADNGNPIMTSTFNQSFHIIQSHGEITLNNSIINVNMTSATFIGRLDFVCPYCNTTTIDRIIYRLMDFQNTFKIINKNQLILLSNAAELTWKKIIIKIQAVINLSSTTTTPLVTQSNVRLVVEGHSVCQTAKCPANSTCKVRELDRYECMCNYGFINSTDKSGECVNKDDCTPNPCLGVGSICNDLIGDFRCDCVDNRQGKRCEIDDSNVCGGVNCINGVCDNGGCVCSPGWTGVSCDVSVSVCKVLGKCANNATCLDMFMGYVCRCTDQYGGYLCQFPLDQTTKDCGSINGGVIMESAGQGKCVQLVDQLDLMRSDVEYALDLQTQSDRTLLAYETSFFRFMSPLINNRSISIKLYENENKVYKIQLIIIDEFKNIMSRDDVMYIITNNIDNLNKLTNEFMVASQILSHTNSNPNPPKSKSTRMRLSIVIIIVPIIWTLIGYQ